MDIKACLRQAKNLVPPTNQQAAQPNPIQRQIPPPIPIPEPTIVRNLEQVRRQVVDMNGRGKKRKNSNTPPDSEDDGSSGESENEEETSANLKPVGMLPEESKKKSRINYLKSKLCSPTGRWKCKYCGVGDGKIDGLSSYDMKLIYNLEEDLRDLQQDQLITTVVDTYNEKIVEENTMRNPQERLEKLTYEEYELHLIECYSKRNVKERMWKRANIYEEEIDYIRNHGMKFRTDDGRLLLNHKDSKTVSNMESQLRSYFICIDRISTRNKKDKERQTLKLKMQAARANKSFYDK